MLSFLKKIILPLLLCSGFLLLYISHLSRSVYGGDVGDLVTAATVGGVPHPPGYPLFTFFGFLLAHSVFASVSPAFAVGLISAISAAVGVVAFYYLTRLQTKNTLTALIGSLILGFSFLYWFYAEIAEVFELNAFFAIILFLLALLYYKTRKQPIILAFFFFLGLACTHHQTIILIFPSLFLLIGKNLFVTLRKNFLVILLYIFFFLTGLTPFFYIFIASSHQPIINWDTVHNLSSFLHLILRKDYGTFQAGIFSTPSLSQRLLTLWVYVQYLIFQLTIPTVFLIMVGFWKLWKIDKIIFLSIFLAWLLAGPAFLAYAGFPLTSSFIIGAYERFTLLSSVIFLMPLGIGLLAFSQWLAQFLPKRKYELLFQCLFLFIPCMLFIYNLPKTNLSSLTIGDTYARDYIDVLPKNAVLLLSGDTQIFNTWYVHYALHDRPDVLLYNIGAAPITNNVIADSLSDVPSKNRSEVLIATIKKLQYTRPIFSTIQFQPRTGKKVLWVPYGLTYEMFQDTSTLPDKASYENLLETIWSKMHIPTQEEKDNPASHNLTVTEIPNDYSNALIAAGTFVYSSYQDVNETLFLYQKARNTVPTNENAYMALGVFYMGMGGRCLDAENNLSTSLEINSYQETPYFLLYNLYTTCLKNSQKAKAVANAYSAVFQKDFQKELQQSKKDLLIPAM